MLIIAGSSNGRTPGFGPGYTGSSPVLAALRLASLAQCEHGEALVLRGLGREVYPEFIEGSPVPAAVL